MSAHASDAEPDEGESRDRDEDTLLDRMLNVFAAPGEVFDRLAEPDTKPDFRNWLIPMLLTMAVGLIFTVVVFSQEDIVAKLAQQQEQQFEGMVEEGKMSREQMDTALEMTRKWQTPKVMMISGSVMAVIGNVVFFLIGSSLVWLLASKILRGGVTFGSAAELFGLSFLVFAAPAANKKGKHEDSRNCSGSVFWCSRRAA